MAQEAERSSFVSRWLNRAAKTQSQNPHWMSPLATISGKIDQSYRTDVLRQIEPGGFTRWNVGGNKGLELIPAERVQIVFTPPVYLSHQSAEQDGFGDAGFLMKFRLASRNSE